MAKVSMIIDVMTKGEKGLDSVSKKLNNMADAQRKINQNISSKQYTKDNAIYNMNLHDSNYKRLKDIRDIIKSNIEIQKEEFSGGFAKDESLRKKYDGVVESLKLMDVSGKNALKTLTDLQLASEKFGGKYTTAYRKVENQFFKDEGIDIDYKNLKNLEKSMQRETDLYTKYQERAIKADTELNELESEKGQIGEKTLSMLSSSASYAALLLNIAKQGLSSSFRLLKNIGNIAKTLKNKILKRVNSIAHVFKYMVLRMSFRALLKDWQTFFVDFAKVSDEFNKKFSELYSSVKRVSAAFVSAFAPVIQALTPILTTFSNAIYRVLDAIAQLNTALFLGKDTYISAKDYMRDFADEMDKAKGSAGGLNKQLASFDTINKLSDNKSGGSYTLDDANNVFGNSPILESIRLFAERLKEAWAANDLSPIGEELADKMRGIVDKGLEVFNEDNFKDTILPKITGIRKGLTTFFKKINEDDTSYDFGQLAGSVANDIVLAITTFLSEDDGTSWYEQLGISIGKFLKGMIDRIDFTKLGDFIASIRNLGIKFADALVKELSSTVVDNDTFGPKEFTGDFKDFLPENEGRTYAEKLANGITDMLIQAADKTDYTAWADAVLKGVDSTLNIIIGYLKGDIYDKMSKGASLGNQILTQKDTIRSIGKEIGEIIILGIVDAFAGVGGVIAGLLGTYKDDEGKWTNPFDKSKELDKKIKEAKERNKELDKEIAEIDRKLLIMSNDKAAEYAENTSNGFLGKLTEFVDNVAAWVQGGFDGKIDGAVYDLIDKQNQNVESKEEESFNIWKLFGLGCTTSYAAELENEETGVVAKTSSAIDKANGEIEDRQTEASDTSKTWGENILTGLQSGLANTSLLGKLTTASLNIAKIIKDAFSSKGDENSGGIDSHSPSKVFESFGGYIIEGLQNGLKGKLDSSSLLEKVKAMKEGVLSVKDELINNFGLVQEELTPIFEAISESFKTQLELMVANLNITIKCVKNGLQNMVNAMNDIIKDYNRAARETGGRTISYVGRVNLNTIPMPKLATGAVIPPNQPFAAVLGDQKSGTNIEAPLETIKQALRDVIGNNYGTKEIVMEVDGREFGRAVVDLGNQEQRRIGTRFISR